MQVNGKARAIAILDELTKETNMRLERVYTRKALATSCCASLLEAADAMRRHGVGSLVVVDDTHAGRPPVGIVTDRDIATRGGVGAEVVGNVMTPIVATVSCDADTHEAVELMRAHGVRRLVVTGPMGEVRGVVSIDDIVDGLAADLGAAAAVLKGEVRRDAAGLGNVRY